MTYTPTAVDRISRLAVRGLGRIPAPVVRLLGGKPREVDGLRLDPTAQVALKLLGAVAGETFEKLPLDQGRAQISGEAWVFGSEHPVETVREVSVPGPGGDLEARLYRPAGLPSPSPALLYLHGGGWVLGDLAASDSVCRYLADRAGVTVLSLDYRLAPEHPFPAAVEDVLATYDWMVAHAERLDIDPHRIGVGGESAGGNLSAVLSLVTATERRSDPTRSVPAMQLLFMPALDLADRNTRSYQLFGDGLFLTAAQMDWYAERYFTDPAQAADVRASPLRAENLAGLPPAFVVTAGWDVLRDEGEEYARRLREAGVTVGLRRLDGFMHSMINATGASAPAREALCEAAGAIRLTLAGGL